MFPRFQELFHSVSDKRSFPASEHGLTILADKKIEEDSSSEENINDHEKLQPPADQSTRRDAVDSSSSSGGGDSGSGEAVGHAADCSCPNCNELISRFSECGLCLEPLQCSGPCACAWCGGLWCARCSRRVSRCAWCRATLRAPAPPCLALQRLVNELMLPCRNYRRGCTESLTAVTRTKHEEQCKFDQTTCPLSTNCTFMTFEELAEHLHSNHHIIAVYSQKIKILIENFQAKLKKTACCRTKYKIILLYHKSAFIIKVCIYNYHVKVEVMRRKLGYFLESKEPKKSEYCALIEFQSTALSTKTAVLIENETYSKKAELQWTDINNAKSETDEAITIHVNIGLSKDG